MKTRIPFWVVIVFILGIAITSYTDMVGRVNEALQAAHGELQAKRALTISEDSLPELHRIDVALAIRRETLETLKPLLLKSLNEAKETRKAEVLFEDLAFVLDDQLLGLDVGFAKKFEEMIVHARLQVSSYVAATGSATAWNLYADGIEVTRIDGASRFTEAVVKVLVDGLDRLLPAFNAILDEAINDDPEKAIILSLNRKNLISQHLSDYSTDDFSFDEKELLTGLVTQGSAVLIDRRGVFVTAQVEFVAPNQVKDSVPKFPKDTDLVRRSMSDWEKKVQAYRAAIVDRVAASASREFDPLIELQNSGFGVTKPALARLINFNLRQGAISGTLRLNKSFKEETNLDLRFAKRDCMQYFGGCDYKNICEGNRCVEEFDQDIQKTCQFSCCLTTGFLGCILPGVCSRACNEIRKVIRPIQSARCDAFRLTDKLYGGALCAIASNVDKAVCDAGANLRKAACDIEQEVVRFYEVNPLATVTAEVTPNATMKLAAQGGSITPDLTTLEATVSGGGGGRLAASIHYDRHNYADLAVIPAGISLGLACAFDWKEAVEVDASAKPFTERLKFEGKATINSEKMLVLDFKQAEEKTIFVDFSPAPLIALFGGKPQVTLNCPLLALGSAVFGAVEGVLKQEDARKVFPLLTGERFPIKVKDKRLSARLPPMKLCGPDSGDNCAAPLVMLTPDITTNTIRYLESQL